MVDSGSHLGGLIIMPRRASDQVITHRIELGVAERKHLDSVVAPFEMLAIGKTVGFVVGAGALGLAAYGLYWFFDSKEKIVQRINENWWADPFIYDEDDSWYWNWNPVTGPSRLLQRSFGINASK